MSTMTRAEYSREWQRKNPDKVKSYSRKWNAANPEKRREIVRNWWAKNPHKVKEYQLRRNAKQREKYWLNPEKSRAICRSIQAANRERVRAANRKWHSKNPDKHRTRIHRRRALQKSVTFADCSDKIKLLMSERFCHWCCTRLTDENHSIDHVIPIVGGGFHIPDNLVAACIQCNCSKGSKLIEEWKWIAA